MTGSIVSLSTLGLRPNLESYQGAGIRIGFASFILSLVTKRACVWTIPAFKLRINSDVIRDAFAVRIDIGIASWIGVISFLGGILIYQYCIGDLILYQGRRGTCVHNSEGSACIRPAFSLVKYFGKPG